MKQKEKRKFGRQYFLTILNLHFGSLDEKKSTREKSPSVYDIRYIRYLGNTLSPSPMD